MAVVGTIRYLLYGLEATPIVMGQLLSEADPSVFDKKPDPERFSLREVVCHLSDWEGVWIDRIQKMVSEECPELPSYDEGQWAIEHNYAIAHGHEQLVQFCNGREKLMAFLKSLSESDWERNGIHAQWGPIDVLALATIIAGHDGYHLRQVVEWLNS